MSPPVILVRRTHGEDVADILTLVNLVTKELYEDLLGEVPPADPDPGFWMRGWVAAADSLVVGVGVATGNYIDDLWVKAGYRRCKIGTMLLQRLERQVASHGYRDVWLRVVAANLGARRFYVREGWEEIRSYPHELLGIEMMDMRKVF